MTVPKVVLAPPVRRHSFDSQFSGVGPDGRARSNSLKFWNREISRGLSESA
jgi:hypothetical protein